MIAHRRLALYLAYARCSFRRQTAYPLANWTGVAVNLFFFLIHVQVYRAFFGARESVAGWKPDEAIVYLATCESLLMVLGVFPTQTGYDFAERVRSGDIAIDLVRPVSLWARSLAERFGAALYYALARGAIVFAAALLIFRPALPRAPELLWLALSLPLGVAVGGLLAFAAQSSAFWIENPRGAVQALTLLLWFFGGTMVPLDFYPPPLRAVSDVLPFRAAIYTPVALATGKLTGASLAFALAHQLAWTALLVAAAGALERRGLRRLIAQGG
jgi:ABC-2 type transport system permease protein